MYSKEEQEERDQLIKQILDLVERDPRIGHAVDRYFGLPENTWWQDIYRTAWAWMKIVWRKIF